MPKIEEKWNVEDLKKVELNAKAINMMHWAISFKEHRKISQCETAKKCGINLKSLMKEHYK